MFIYNKILKPAFLMIMSFSHKMLSNIICLILTFLNKIIGSIKTNILAVSLYIGRIALTYLIRLLATTASCTTFLENVTNISQEVRITLTDIIIQTATNKLSIEDIHLVHYMFLCNIAIVIGVAVYAYTNWDEATQPCPDTYAMYLGTGAALLISMRLGYVIYHQRDFLENDNYKDYDYDRLLDLSILNEEASNNQKIPPAKPIQESKFFIGKKVFSN